MKEFLILVLFAVLCAGQTDPDLPHFIGNIESIPECSLIIPMDQSQTTGTVFNLKAYGLVNHLLWKNILVKWAIRAGKTKFAIDRTRMNESNYWDFTAQVQQVLPTPSSNTITKTFYAGAFIIPVRWAPIALNISSAWGNGVVMYRLVSTTNIDIRYTLTKKPYVAVLDSSNNYYIQANMLRDAGFVECYSATHCPTCPRRNVCGDCCHFQIMTKEEANSVSSDTCISIATEPHFHAGYPTGATFLSAMRTFVASGGNFLAQCGGISTYENCDWTNWGSGPSQCKVQQSSLVPEYFFATLGLDTDKSRNNLPTSEIFTFPTADGAYSQFTGVWSPQGGSVPYFKLYDKAGVRSVMNRNSHWHVGMQGTPTYIAAQTKLDARTGQRGGNVFYLGGHDYCGSSCMNDRPGVRLYLNAMFIPGERNTLCELDVSVDAHPIVGTSPNGNPLLTCGCNKYEDNRQPYTDPTPPGRTCCALNQMDNCDICGGDGRSCRPGTCQPTTDCTREGVSCGHIWNGCAKVSCGFCQTDYVCNSTTGQCQYCPPNTCQSQGKECGLVSTPCGIIDCGTCPTGDKCVNGQCEPCVPAGGCGNVQCGTVWDGCQEITCGSCNASANLACTDGRCQPCQVVTTCQEAGRTCSTYWNNCAWEDCGTCTGTDVCIPPGFCVSCIPTTSCSTTGARCGNLWNGCETVSCGNCVGNDICVSGTCVPPTPPTTSTTTSSSSTVSTTTSSSTSTTQQSTSSSSTSSATQTTSTSSTTQTQTTSATQSSTSSTTQTTSAAPTAASTSATSASTSASSSSAGTSMGSTASTSATMTAGATLGGTSSTSAIDGGITENVSLGVLLSVNMYVIFILLSMSIFAFI